MKPAIGQYRFSVFSLDLQERTLHRGRFKAALQNQAFLVLQCLITRHGQVVTREAISDELWGDAPHFDADQAINKAVNQIRWCLGDSPKAARYIETVPRLGYRFVAPVEFFPAEETPQPTPSFHPERASSQVQDTHAILATAAEPPLAVASQQPLASPEPLALATPWKPRPRGPRVIVLAVLAILLLAAVTILWMHHRAAYRIPPPAPPIRGRISLMVVPIQAAAGLQEKAERLRYDLADTLGHVPEIRVPATHLVQGSRKDAESLQDVLRDSKSDYLLMGELHAKGDDCVFTAELVRAAELTHVANIEIESPSCQLPDLRERTSYAVQHSLLGNEAKPGETASSGARAYEAYLEGEHDLYTRTNDSLDRANAHFHEAVALDPQFADGYAGMANVYLILADRNGLPDGYGMAMRLARRAIQIKPSSALAHGVLGCATLSLNRDWAAAFRELQLASELAPDEAVFHMWLSSFYSASGDSAKAVEQFKDARDADPFWPPVYQAGTLAYKNAEDYTDMLGASQQLVKFAPDVKRSPEWMVAYQTEGSAFWLLQRYREAVQARRQAAQLSNDPELQATEATAAAAFQRGGPTAYARVLIHPYENGQKKLRQASLEDAEWAVYAAQPELALAMLKVIAERNTSESINIPSDPVFRTLRKSPAFTAIVASLQK